jgi:hypothetical protein
MSWSTNWPKNVVPAVWVGLFGLFTLSKGSVISSTGPLARSSLASSGPPLAPSSRSAALTASVAGTNGGSLSKIRPKVVGLVETVELRAAGGARTAAGTPPDRASAPAPAPVRLRKPLLL